MVFIKKLFNVFMILVLFFSYIVPVYAIGDSNEISSNENTLTKKIITLKDDSPESDFNYKLNVDDTIKVIYSDEDTVNNYFLTLLNNKINDNNIKAAVNSVNEKEVSYTLTGYGDSYSGVFTYDKTLSLELTNVNNTTIETYFKKILGNVDVKIEEIDSSYKITINNKSEIFKILNNTKSIVNNKPILTYGAHVQNIGDQPFVSEGNLAGTTGQGKGMEALTIKLNTSISGSIRYQTHVSGYGWQSYVNNNSVSGTKGQGRQIEALRIELTGELAKQFDIYYKVHCQNFGWFDWAKNGEMAGSSGFGKNLEAVMIKIVPKGEKVTVTGKSYKEAAAMSFTYDTHSQNIGWKNGHANNSIGGADGKNLEALRMRLNSPNTDGGIKYQAHVSGIGWQKEVNSNSIAGTTGQGRGIEAIRISLTGSIAEKYDIFYRVKVDGKWLGWAKNGDSAGTVNAGKQIHTIQINFVKKNESQIKTGNSFLDGKASISYNTYVDTKGWQGVVSDGASSGTTGQGLQIKALNINLKSDIFDGTIKYKIKTINSDWSKDYKLGETAGDENSNDKIDGVIISLSGALSKEVNMYYRVHASGRGWLGWAKSGEKAGCEGSGIEAIEIKLLAKSLSFNTGGASYIPRKPDIVYQAHVSGVGWLNQVKNGETAGIVGQGKSIEGLKISLSDKSISGSIEYKAGIIRRTQSKVSQGQLAGTTGQGLKLESLSINLTGDLANYYDVYYRVHCQNIGWIGWVKNGTVTGTTGANKQLEGFEIRLVLKNDPAPGVMAKSGEEYRAGLWQLKSVSGVTFSTYTDAFGVQVKNFRYISGIKHYFTSDGYLLVKNAKRIIDVSKWQGNIDWNIVKHAGDENEVNEVDGAIVEIASALEKGLDSQLANNIQGLTDNNIPYGIYLFSYAAGDSYCVDNDTLKLGCAHSGALEAKAFEAAVRTYNMNLSYPMYYDLEEWTWNDDAGGVHTNTGWNSAFYDSIIREFDNQMQKYAVQYQDQPNLSDKFRNWQIYAGPYWSKSKLAGSAYVGRISWIPHYTTLPNQFNLNKTWNMWQYTSEDHVAGISGNVDSSVFGDFVWRP